jgi:glycosyltransferase involved in cell wall biosynthesis
MRIALNTTAFIPGKMGGIETYFRKILACLQKVNTGDDYFLLVDSHYTDEYLLTSPNFNKVMCNFTEPSLLWFIRGVLRNTLKFDILKPVLNRLPVDIIHHPFSTLIPPGLKIPSVLTFHDIQHEFFPEFFVGAEMKNRRDFSRRSAIEATRIIAISEHVKSSLVDKYQVSPDKIDVVYNGYGHEYQVMDSDRELELVKMKYALDRPFMYYPAATWPHKNHKKLLEAMRLLSDKYNFDGNLVLTGVAKQSNNEILGDIDRLRLTDRVKILGYLPYGDIPSLYNLARLLVYPSLFEGFGLPLVEAMACGCPIVCSNVTAMPEVVKNAALFFTPTSEEDIADKIWSVWNDDSLRGQLVLKGRERVKQFQWERSARETIEVYRKALVVSASATKISPKGVGG